jgi:hypothetical protein
MKPPRMWYCAACQGYRSPRGTVMMEWRLIGESRRNLERNPIQCHFAHEESHMKSLGTKPRLRDKKPAPNSPSYGWDPEFKILALSWNVSKSLWGVINILVIYRRCLNLFMACLRTLSAGHAEEAGLHALHPYLPGGPDSITGLWSQNLNPMLRNMKEFYSSGPRASKILWDDHRLTIKDSKGNGREAFNWVRQDTAKKRGPYSNRV